jgi:hypothetical protein|tara:strand:- start:1303 stop:1557 length:255 start_codon:yes stop_codon:yes gene_type:complete
MRNYPSDMKVKIKPSEGEARFEKRCGVTGEMFVITIDFSDYKRWERGMELIQDILPNLDKAEREFLISGTTPEEFAEMFPSCVR